MMCYLVMQLVTKKEETGRLAQGYYGAKACLSICFIT